MPYRRPGEATFITRFEYSRAKGWLVRFESKPKPLRKFFSDSVYGGIKRALKAATAFRDNALKNRPPPAFLRELSSGRPFIKWQVYRHRKTGERVFYRTWSAWCRNDQGRIERISFSIEKHGRYGAREKAEAWLREATAAKRSESSRARPNRREPSRTPLGGA